MPWTQDSLNTNKTLSSIARCEGVTTYEYIIKSIFVTRHIKTLLTEAAQFFLAHHYHYHYKYHQNKAH